MLWPDLMMGYILMYSYGTNGSERAIAEAQKGRGFIHV